MGIDIQLTREKEELLDEMVRNKVDRLVKQKVTDELEYLRLQILAEKERTERLANSISLNYISKVRISLKGEVHNASRVINLIDDLLKKWVED